MCFKNRNICAAFLFVASNGVTYSIWGSPLLPLFLQVFTGDTSNSTSYVGIAEGAQGATQCFFALISGVLADKVSRHVVLKAAGAAQLLAAAATLLAVYYDKIFLSSSSPNNGAISWTTAYSASSSQLYHIPLTDVGTVRLGPSDPSATCLHDNSTSSNMTTLAPVTPFNPHDNLQWYLLCAACGMWGMYSGLYGPSMEAIFADSIETGERAKYYTKRRVVQTTARATGPVLALIAFYALNDQWTLPILTWVLTGGLVLTVFPSMILMCMFHDRYTVGLQNEAITATRETIIRRQTLNKLQNSAENQGAVMPPHLATDTIDNNESSKKEPSQIRVGSESTRSSDRGGAIADAAPTEGDKPTQDKGDHHSDGLPDKGYDINTENIQEFSSNKHGSGTTKKIPNRSDKDRRNPPPHGLQLDDATELVDPLSGIDNQEELESDDVFDQQSTAVSDEKHESSFPDDGISDKVRCCQCCAGVRAIPWIILASNTVTGLATGMTVKFFPVFFKNEVCLTPADVNIIYAVTPFLQVR